MNHYPVTHPKCECITDRTWETSVLGVRRGRPLDNSGRSTTIRRAKRIHHARESDGARFWHWSDVKVVVI